MDHSKHTDPSPDSASSFLLAIIGVLLAMLAICGLIVLLN